MIPGTTVEFIRCTKRGEYFDVQVAINGTLAIPFEVHASIREQMNDEKWEKYCAEQAQTLITLYGDARDQRLQEAA